MGAGASKKPVSQAVQEQPLADCEAGELIKLQNAMRELEAENKKLKKESSHWQSELQELRVEHEHLNANFITIKNQNRELFEQTASAASPAHSPDPRTPICHGPVKACDKLRVWLVSMDIKDVLTEITLEDTNLDKSKVLPALGHLDQALKETRDAFSVH